MQSYFNPETQRVKSLWQTYHALFAAAQQQQSAFLRYLAFAALSAAPPDADFIISASFLLRHAHTV